MKLPKVQANLAFLSANISGLGYPIVIETLCAASRDAALKEPEKPKLAEAADAERADWRAFLDVLHELWVKAGQPKDGRAFLAGFLIAHTNDSPFQ